MELRVSRTFVQGASWPSRINAPVVWKYYSACVEPGITTENVIQCSSIDFTSTPLFYHVTVEVRTVRLTFERCNIHGRFGRSAVCTILRQLKC